MQTTVQGLNIHYETVGQGPDILLLHGWGSSGDAFRLMMKEFGDRFRLTAIDFPGFGHSDEPPVPWEIADYVQWTLALMQTLGLKDPILIGHSFGGRVIMRMAGAGLCHPPKIILLDAAGIKPQKTIKQRLRGRCFKIVKGILSMPGIRKVSQGLLERARNYFGSADYNSATPVMRQTLVKVVNEDLRAYLPGIQAPTLLIWGEKDTTTPVSDAKIIEQEIPDAGLCVIRGAGHFAFVERPFEVHVILNNFLNG